MVVKLKLILGSFKFAYPTHSLEENISQIKMYTSKKY